MGRTQKVSTGGSRGESLDLFNKSIFVGCQLTPAWLQSCVPETPYPQNAAQMPSLGKGLTLPCCCER